MCLTCFLCTLHHIFHGRSASVHHCFFSLSFSLFLALPLDILCHSCLVVNFFSCFFLRTRNVYFYCYYSHVCILVLEKLKNRFLLCDFLRIEWILNLSGRFHRFCYICWLRSSFQFYSVPQPFLTFFFRISCINKCLRIMYVRPLETIIRLLFLTLLPFRAIECVCVCVCT